MNLNKILLFATLIVVSLLLTACGDEIARVQFQSVGSNEGTFEHDGGEVELWTDWDVEYQDIPVAKYSISFYQNGDGLAEFECDPQNVKYSLMLREANTAEITKISYLAPMYCDVDLPEGAITMVVNFEADGGGMVIHRADLVVKLKEIIESGEE